MAWPGVVQLGRSDRGSRSRTPCRAPLSPAATVPWGRTARGAPPIESQCASSPSSPASGVSSLRSGTTSAWPDPPASRQRWAARSSPPQPVRVPGIEVGTRESRSCILQPPRLCGAGIVALKRGTAQCTDGAPVDSTDQRTRCPTSRKPSSAT